jgi:hypothetical protein
MKPNNIVSDTVPTAQTPKSAANRENALKSTGPKTLRGKSHSRGNSRKHGFYSRELLVSEADAPEFQDMYTALEAEAKPETKFQELAFDHVVACFWRTKIAAAKQGRHMVVKLLEQRRTFLKELLIIRKRNTLDGMRDARQGSEFNPHLVRDAQRELQRAKDGYWSLRANGH